MDRRTVVKLWREVSRVEYGIPPESILYEFSQRIEAAAIASERARCIAKCNGERLAKRPITEAGVAHEDAIDDCVAAISGWRPTQS